MLKNHIWLILVCFVACTPIIKVIDRYLDEFACKKEYFSLCRDIIRYVAVPVALLLLSTAALVGNSFNPFIYFQF